MARRDQRDARDGSGRHWAVTVTRLVQGKPTPATATGLSRAEADAMEATAWREPGVVNVTVADEAPPRRR